MSPQVQVAGSVLKCPRCKTDLRPWTTLYRCYSCHTVWETVTKTGMIAGVPVQVSGLEIAVEYEKEMAEWREELSRRTFMLLRGAGYANKEDIRRAVETGELLKAKGIGHAAAKEVSKWLGLTPPPPRRAKVRVYKTDADECLRKITAYLGIEKCWDGYRLDYDEVYKRIVKGIEKRRK